MSDPAIEIERVSKKYASTLRRSLGYGLIDLGRNLVGAQPKVNSARKGEFWAVDDVSLSIDFGEAVGIVGSNGAGKSTLLRMLAGILPPDRGRITVRGRVAALIAVGTGFHPHLTGRENIYLNGALLGLTKPEIDDRFDEIVAFADIGTFLESPVTMYSSGMKGRLGFAVSTVLDPDVLLLDEVLATGDLAFKQRCLRRLDELKSSTTIVLVTHMPTHIQRVCDRVVWLDGGEIIRDGPTSEVLGEYAQTMMAAAADFADRPDAS